MSSIVSVDVGWKTGLAYFKNKDTSPRVLQLNARGKTTEEKIKYMAANFKHYLFKLPESPSIILLEGVEFYGNSLRSVTATRRGDLFTLAYLVGVYIGVCITLNLRFKVSTFNEWGGQMTPEVINKRLDRALGEHFRSQHINDAVAMGLTYYRNKYFTEVR